MTIGAQPLAQNWRDVGHTIQIGSPDLPWSCNVREFRDLEGTRWSVFRATPHTSPSRRARVLPETYRLGWLVFECERERRRLAPVPENWEELTERELERLCTLADVVPARALRGASATNTPAPGDASAPANAPAPVERREPNSPGQWTSEHAAQMQALLARMIKDVCDKPPTQSLDTGELIRVEETLAMAANAAREAVALRRAERATRAK